MSQNELNDILSAINLYKNSDEYKQILIQNRYYSNKIYEKKQEAIYNNRIFIHEDGEDFFPYHNNEAQKKLSVAFFRKLVDQKINYLLGNSLTLECDDKIKKYFNSDLYQTIYSTATDAVKHGQGWMMAYYTENAELKFKYVPTKEILPIWQDYDQTILDKVYRFYTYNDEDYIIIYSKDGITKIKDGVVIEENLPMLVINEEKKSFIPFIYFDYNYERISLLDFVKDLIDDYNEQLSSRANNLLNITKSIKVVKNYDGTSLREAERNMNLNRIIGVSEGGDVKVIQVPIESVAVEDQLEQLMQNIYDAGRGVNFTRENLGNSSGIALKFKYSDLDADTDNMSLYIKKGIEKIIKFIVFDLNIKGNTFNNEDCKIVFNKNRIINETEMIDNLTKLRGVLSDETIITLLPFNIDTKKELELIAKERANNLKEEYNYEGYGIDPNSNSSRESIKET